MAIQSTGNGVVLEGRINSKSGEIVIIDPAYLVGFSTKFVDGKFEEFQNRWSELREKSNWELKSIDDLGELERIELSMLACLPPYIAQLGDAVMFRNPLGDGYYPVTQTKKRTHIVFDYPISGGELDESRLNGKLVGFSNVDSGMQVIADARSVVIKENEDPNLYCKLQLPNGGHQARFINQNYSVSIR